MDRISLSKAVLGELVTCLKDNHEKVADIYDNSGSFVAFDSSSYAILSKLCDILVKALGADEYTYYMLAGTIEFQTNYNTYKSKTEISICDLDKFIDENFK